MQLTDDQLASAQQAVTKALEENPSFMPQMLAQELNLPLESIIAALPEEMRVKAPGEDTVAIWEEICNWEKITFMLSSNGMILELGCQLPKGKSGHGMYNLMGKNLPFGGHVIVNNIASIWFVSKPLFGLESHSVQFFDAAGNQGFAMYLGRDEKRQVLPNVREQFITLKNKYQTK